MIVKRTTSTYLLHSLHDVSSFRIEHIDLYFGREELPHHLPAHPAGTRRTATRFCQVRDHANRHERAASETHGSDCVGEGAAFGARAALKELVDELWEGDDVGRGRNVLG
jgi:hypothetical protein